MWNIRCGTIGVSRIFRTTIDRGTIIRGLTEVDSFSGSKRKVSARNCHGKETPRSFSVALPMFSLSRRAFLAPLRGSVARAPDDKSALIALAAARCSEPRTPSLEKVLRSLFSQWKKARISTHEKLHNTVKSCRSHLVLFSRDSDIIEAEMKITERGGLGPPTRLLLS